MATQNIGTVIQIIGPVLDIRFEAGCLPNLLNAIEIDNKGKKLVVEVAQHIGDDTGLRLLSIAGIRCAVSP